MSQVYLGEVRAGVIVLQDGSPLPEGARVQVTFLESGLDPEADLRQFWDGLLEFAGQATGLPPDLAENHDHYLHGRPKR